MRVHRYMSNMVIKPHKSFEEAGLDYVLTYYDDPQATIPSVAMSWMTATGVPKFTEDLRQATLNFVNAKGKSVVSQMFQRRVEEQPLATLKKRQMSVKEDEGQQQQQQQQRLEELEKAEAEIRGCREENEVEKEAVTEQQPQEKQLPWSGSLLDRNNNNADEALSPSSISSRLHGLIQVGETAEDASVKGQQDHQQQQYASIDESATIPKGEMIGSDLKPSPETVLDSTLAGTHKERDVDEVVGEKPPHLLPEMNVVEEERLGTPVADAKLAMPLPLQNMSGNDDAGTSTFGEKQPVVETVHLPDADDLVPIRHGDHDGDRNITATTTSPTDSEGGIAAPAALPHSWAQQHNENNNNNSPADVLDIVETETAAMTTTTATQFNPTCISSSSSMTLADDARSVVTRVDVQSKLFPFLLLNHDHHHHPTNHLLKGRWLTLRDLVWELSSSSTPLYALQGRDYPGLHANNPSYLVARSSALWRGIDAFCWVK